MDDQRSTAGAMLRRPVVDPDIPRRDRLLLTAPGTFLTPAYLDGPARRRDILPADPGRRGATIDGAVMGLVAAAFTAVGGTVPLAIGVLAFAGPVGWQSVSSHYALLLALIIAVVTAVVFGVRIACFRPIQRPGASRGGRPHLSRPLPDRRRFRRPGQSPAAARARRRGRRHFLAGLPVRPGGSARRERRPDRTGMGHRPGAA